MAAKNELTIVAKLRDLASKGFRRMGKGLLRTTNRIANKMIKLTALVGAAGLAFAGFAGISSFLRLAEDIDKVAKNAKRLRIGTKELSALNHAAELSGSSTRSLSKGIQNLQRQAVEAARGNKIYARSFQDLGVDYEALADGSISVTQALGQVSDGLQGIDSQALRVNASMNLFGRAGVDLLPMLQGGSKELMNMAAEAERLGATVGEGTAKKFEQFQDAALRMQKAIRGIFLKLADKILPLLSGGMNMLAENIAAQSDNIVEGLIAWGIRLAEVVKPLLRVFEVFARLAAVKLQVIVIAVQSVQVTIDALNVGLQAIVGTTFDYANAQLKAAESTELMQLMYAGLLDTISGKAGADALALIGKTAEKLKNMAADLAGRPGLPTNNGEGFVGPLQKIQRQAEKTGEPFKALNRLWAGMKAGLGELRDRFANTFELGRQVAVSAGTAITDSMADAFEGIILGTKTATQAFKAFGKSVLQILARVIAKLIATRIALSFLGFGGSSTNTQAPTPGTGPGGNTQPGLTGIGGPSVLGLGGPGGGGVNINFHVQTIDSTSFKGWLAKERDTVIGVVKNAMTRETSTRRAFGR